jgi:zinc transporter 1
MHSVFLHVLGDALGSVAVIASSLFIWLTDFSWKYYVDPLVRYNESFSSY